MGDGVARQRDDDFQLLGGRCENELVDLLALVSIKRHWEAVRALDEHRVELLERQQNLFLQYPLEFQLLKLDTGVSINIVSDWQMIQFAAVLQSITVPIKH